MFAMLSFCTPCACAHVPFPSWLRVRALSARRAVDPVLSGPIYAASRLGSGRRRLITVFGRSSTIFSAQPSGFLPLSRRWTTKSYCTVSWRDFYSMACLRRRCCTTGTRPQPRPWASARRRSPRSLHFRPPRIPAHRRAPPGPSPRKLRQLADAAREGMWRPDVCLS